MASSSSQRVADGRAPPSPDQLAAFYKLVDKKVIAGVLCRHARVVELSASAAALAEALFGGEDSLVVANLRMCESQALTNLAIEASGAEQLALVRQAWGILVLAIPLLLRRVEANTLLPGTVREEELDYAAHVQATANKVTNKPVPPPAVLRTTASTMGYVTLVLAMYRSLDLLPCPLWPAAQKRIVDSFVLQRLDVIPRTASIPAHLIAGEDRLVAIFEENINTRTFDPPFCAAVLRKWRSDAVSSVLRAHGVLQTGIAAFQKDNAELMPGSAPTSRSTGCVTAPSPPAPRRRRR